MRGGRLALAFCAIALPSMAQNITLAPVHAAAVVLTPAQIGQLPAVTEDITFQTAHGPFTGSFSGPLLWTILQKLPGVEGKNQVREAVLVTGTDGYTALLALAELAPAFEGKKIILADTLNGKPTHLRVIVPGDVHGGRDVHDVIRIAVLAPTS